MTRRKQPRSHALSNSSPLRLLLAVLLALAPLLSIAQSVPLMATVGPVESGTVEAGSGPSSSTEVGSMDAMPAERLADSSEMPCHGGAMAAATHTAMHNGPDDAEGPCPHCTGDATASACQCCGHAAPAGLTVPVIETHPDSAHADDYVELFPDRVPHPCNDRLYRPPIHSS